MSAVPRVRWPVRPRTSYPEPPVSACRLWQLALMLHAAGVDAFGTPELRRALAAEHRFETNRGLRGNLARGLLGALPLVNQTNVCPPPFFWLALPLPLSLASRPLPMCGLMSENHAGFRPRKGGSAGCRCLNRTTSTPPRLLTSGKPKRSQRVAQR